MPKNVTSQTKHLRAVLMPRCLLWTVAPLTTGLYHTCIHQVPAVSKNNNLLRLLLGDTCLEWWAEWVKTLTSHPTLEQQGWCAADWRLGVNM